uniref:xin actin-binding repeat-containing protein 2 isoform X1 n=4 Tax=Pristiophorus japonicus TaxID=55135 RepID=UPI00398F1F66
MESESETRMMVRETQRKDISASPLSTQDTELIQNEIVKEDLQAARRIERFAIPLGDLKMLFEKSDTPKNSKKELRGGGSPSPPLKQQAGNPSGSSSTNLDCKVRGKLQKTMPLDGKETNSSAAAVLSDEPSQADSVPLDIQETVSLKDRMAMYQAAVSKKESSSSSVADAEEEARTLPGGLASMKKQFEAQEIASSQSTAAHYHYQQRSVQDMTSASEVKVNSSIRKTDQGDGPPPANKQLLAYQMETVSVIEQNTHQSSMVSNFENHFNDFNVDVVTEDEKPKASTQMLKQQFEKSAQPTQLATNTTKQIKTEHNFQEMQWPPIVSTSNISTATGKISEATSLRKIDNTTASVYVNSSNRGSMEEFPPPPPDLLNTPSEITYSSQSPEPSLSSTKQVIPKELYSKQRNLYELKRLYKHINPEVRKNLEKEFIQEISEIVTNETKDNDVMGDVQQAKYVFEHTGHSPQKCVSPEREYLEWDEILKGEVQSMRWMFETQPLDSIKDESPDQSNAKCISQQGMIAGGDVKYTAWMFETQAIDMLGVSSPESIETTGKIPELARGDVRTATWLFETQPLDSMNKIYQEGDQPTETSATQDVTAGDVKTARYLFETQPLDTLGHLDSVDEVNFLHLKTEVEEIKGNVKKTTKLFETQPLYVIRDQSGQVLEIKTVKREEIERGDVRTARWLFETKPLDVINKDVSSIKVVCGISREEVIQGGVNRAKWLFETHPLDSIKEQLETDTSVNYKEEIQGADVSRQCWMFETQKFDSLKDNDNARPTETEVIIGGDVRSTKHLFETVPLDALKDSPDVGKLKYVIASEEEKGDVRHQTWIFETQPLEMIGEEKEKYTKSIQLEEIKKGDVSNYRQVFETMNLSYIDESKKIQVDGVTSGAVMSNRTLFETTPLYAVQDSAGHYHEVKTVRREEIVRGDVRTCRWMFETTPIDQFDESIQKCQIIKGISKEEIQSGDVKTAKWLFETQPLDAIKYFSNVEDEEIVTKQRDDVKGDVQTCRWLFETQPMDALYEKVDNKNEVDEIQKGDVKTCTWLFETQPLDAIKDNSETIITMRTIQREDIQGSDVRMARFLFETESLGNIQGEKDEEFRRLTKIDIQSGDVSRKKWIFENKSLDLINSSSEEVLKQIRSMTAEDIQKGNVINCTWLFENHPIDAIKENSEEREILHTITDVQGGDVGKGRFIFETYSLDQIKEESSETTDFKKCNMEQIEKGDVKNYTMLFETQPLYAIKDKEGYYHEVTTVRKEEVISGDVRGTRWLFETKPLDLIKETDEVYVIKAVTQEDIQKGDVTSARWRFETQPLDKIADHEKVILKTVCDVQGGDVRSSTQLFESDLDQKYVRTVSVSEIQHGNVRTATWLFESHTIDEIKGEDSEYKKIETVGREDVQKGDVKQAIWLFEKQPLDSIQEINDPNIKIVQEDIPQADVKTTTWLFETTPLHQFNESSVERPEIVGKNIEETLKSLYDCKILQSQGILIEANEVGDVRMAKYQLLNQTSPEIQKELIVRGDLQNIMMELLSKRESTEKGITVDHDEKGNIHLTTAQLLKRTTDINVEKEEIIGCDIQQVINNLLRRDNSSKKGILIQESEKGDVRMTVYSLLNRTDDTKVKQDEVIKGDIQAAIDKLIATSQSSELSQKVKLNDTEKGNVQFYTTCIESGALDYLKLLQQETDETAVVQQESEEIIHGDVEGAKKMLEQQQMQIERTVAESEILSGDVQNAVLAFMAERQNISANVEKEEIIGGDLRTALDSLNQAINQPTLVEKEQIVRGNLSATLKSLEEAKSQKKYIEKFEVIPGDIKSTLDSLEKSVNTRAEAVEEDVMHGDLQFTSKYLEEAQSKLKQVEKEVIMNADFQVSVRNLLETASEKKAVPYQMSNKEDVKATIQDLLEPTQQQVQPQASGAGAVQNTIKIHQEGQKQIPNAKGIGHKGAAHDSVKTLLAAQEQSKMDITKNVNTMIRTKLNVEQHEGTKKVNMKADDSVKSDIQEKVQSLLPPDKQHQYNAYDIFKEDVKKISDVHSTRITSKHIGVQSVQATRIKSTDEKYNAHKVKENFGSVDRQTAKHMVSVSADSQRSFQPPRTTDLIEMPDTEICTGANIAVAQVMNSQTIQGTSTLQEIAQVSNQTVQTFASPSIMEHDVKSKQEIKSIKELHKTVDDRSQIINKGLAPKIKSGTTSLEKLRTSTNKMDIKTQNTRKKGLSHVKMNRKSMPEVQFPIPPPPPPAPLSSDADLLLPPPPPSHIEEDGQMFPLPPPPPPLVQIKSEMYETELPPSPLPPPPSPPITPTITLVQEKFTAGYLPPSPIQSELNLLPLPPSLPQSPPHQRKLVIKASKLQSLPKMPNLESIKPKEQLKKKVPLISKPNVIIAEDSTSSKLDIQQQKHEPSQEKEHEPIQHSTCPQAIQSSPPQPVIRPVQKLPQKKEAQGPSAVNKVFVPLDPSPKTETAKPQPKPYARKFKTPLMIAEEKYRKEREEMEKNKATKMVWPINMGKPVAEVSTSPDKGGSENTMKPSVFPTVTSAADYLTSPASQVTETENMPTVAKHQIYPKPAVPSATKHQDYPKPAVSTIGHQDYPKPAVSTASEHHVYPKPAVSSGTKHQDYPKPTVPTASEDQMSTKTMSSASAKSAVISASEQLHRILKYSSDEMSNKEEIFNAFKDSVKDIGLETIKQHKEVHKKVHEQPSHLKPQSISLPIFKIKTIQLPKGDQIVQEKKESALSYKKKQKHISKLEENKNQEKTAIKQFQLKQNDYVDVAEQEQHNIIVQQHNHLGEYYQSASDINVQNNEKTSLSQTLATNMAQNQVKNKKEAQQHNQQSYTAKLKETQKVQQKKEKGAMYKEVKSEKMQKHHVKAQKEAFPKIQGEQDQQKGDLAMQVINQRPLGEQAHVQKHLDWKEIVISENQVEYKTQQDSFQAKEEQVCYVRNAGNKQGLVPAHMEDIKQANKESGNTAVHEKEFDKDAARLYVEISDSYRKREELQNILIRLIQFEKENDNIDLNAIKAFLEKVPKWITDGHGFPMKVTKGNDLQKVKRELTQIKQNALLKLAYFDESIQKAFISMSGLKPEKGTFGCTAPSQKISKISIGSCKLDKQGKSNVEEQACESKKEQLSEIRLAEQRAQSPAKRMPSPSPSYITIESTARRTESPLRTVPSPPLSHKAYSTPSPVQWETTPTPPLLICSSEMPTSRVHTSSTSPSPPRAKRYDQLAKLKDTTAKLSQGISQSTQSTHVPIAEKRSEIIPSPATLRRQLKIETPVTNTLPNPESPVVSVTVKDIAEMFEEARRSEENKVYMRKDPIDIPERLGSDTEEFESAGSKQKVPMPKVDLSELVHKFEMPDKTIYFQKEPVIITERLGSDDEDDHFGKKTVFEEIPTFDMKSVKPVFEISGQAISPENPQGDGKLLKKSQRSHKVKEGMKTSTQSMLYPEAINKQLAHVDEFESEATGSRTSIQHSEIFSGIDSRHAPPTYEDVVSGQILDISADNTPEELLKNFQKTWQESERVFRSLGYKISDTSETMWQEDVLQEHTALTENTGSYQGDLHSLSKDSISHGKSDSRQANLS